MRSSGFRYPYRFTIDVLFRPVWRFTTGDLLADWKGDTAEEAERFEWGGRIREVEHGSEGALYML